MAGKIKRVCLCNLALEGFESLDWHGSASLWADSQAWNYGETEVLRYQKLGARNSAHFSNVYLITKVIFYFNYINNGLHYLVKLRDFKHLINPALPAILGYVRMCKSRAVLLDSPSHANFLKHLRWGITQIWLLWEPSIKTTAAVMAFQSHTFSSKLARTSSYF